MRRRVGAAPPARTAAAPLVALHMISLLGHEVTPGRATRVRTAQRDAQESDTHDRVVRRKALGDSDVESEIWKHNALQSISL